MKRLLYVFPVLVLSSVTAQEVPLIDLTMSDNRQGQVELRVRSNGYFDGVASAMTFTLRWPASAGIALDTAVRCYPFQNVLPVDATAPVVNGGWMYRTFNGFGLTPLLQYGLAWEEGYEYPICTADILVPGTTIELVNDPWTGANNSDYFSSLGGYSSTGIIYQSPEPDVSIRSMNMGTGNLDVILDPADDFFGWVTDLNFTMRWPAGEGVSLGMPLQDPEVAEYLPIVKIGGEITEGGFTYQRFHGEGVKSIANSGQAWHGEQDLPVISIPIFGSSSGLMIMNDEWTSVNEGDYAIELNGIGHEGTIEGIAMGVAIAKQEHLEATVLTVANGFSLSIVLPENAATATFSLHNAAGQSVWSTTREAAHGRMNILAGTGPVSDGLYILSVRHGERSLVKRIIR